MPAPFDFPTSSANIGLPLLFSGQAQKEFFVNQAFALVDALIQQSVVSSNPTPPASPSDGEVYRVTATANEAWAGEEGALAVRIAGGWHFVSPVEGLRIYDRQAAQFLVFKGQWETASAPGSPTGGSVIDTQARAAIDELIDALEQVGILS